MTRLNFESAVVRPKVDGIGDASNAAFVDLATALTLCRMTCKDALPARPLRYQLLRIPDRHTSSSIQRAAEISRESGRRYPGSMRWTGDLNFD